MLNKRLKQSFSEISNTRLLLNKKSIKKMKELKGTFLRLKQKLVIGNKC